MLKMFNVFSSMFLESSETGQIRIMWCLIGVCTVCPCPVKRSLGFNGFKKIVILHLTIMRRRCLTSYLLCFEKF